MSNSPETHAYANFSIQLPNGNWVKLGRFGVGLSRDGTKHEKLLIAEIESDPSIVQELCVRIESCNFIDKDDEDDDDFAGFATRKK